jgi:hypothetical protein
MLLCLVALSACARNAVDKERAEAEREGWTYFETLGEQKRNAELFMWNASDTARSLRVGVVKEGKQLERTYPQDEWLYRSAIFIVDPQDSFALVFRKPKRK